MTDPAVEAAQRAWNDNGKSAYSMVAINAAREALKPIQEWFDRNYGMSSITDHLLDELAPLIFTTEELGL
ncbi:hypothetical protein [Mycobacteroides abscessus]|uniref:hypothetical protein n=1 Tax=Mycobacteroides abscessus TaxID=36809 RepID=UPI00189666F9